MAELRISLSDVLRGASLASIAGGLAVFALTFWVMDWTFQEAVRAVILLQVFIWALTALKGMAGLAPELTMTATVFASSVGAFVGSALGEYARAKGVRPAEAVEDLKASVTAVTAATEKPLFRDGMEDLVSRRKLNDTIANIIMRAHDGQRYSRKAMVDDGICDQRYWGLARHVLQRIGLMELESPLFQSKGDLQLDLEWANRRYRVALGRLVWVLPEGEEGWQEVDLYACHFLRKKGEADTEVAATALRH